jgi:hypothetical protein
LEHTEKLVAEYGYKDEELYNMAKRLGSSDNYASRISAIMLFCRLATCKINKISFLLTTQKLGFPSSKHKDIMSLLSTSTSSEIPAVRKTVAIYIKVPKANPDLPKILSMNQPSRPFQIFPNQNFIILTGILGSIEASAQDGKRGSQHIENIDQG